MQHWIHNEDIQATNLTCLMLRDIGGSLSTAWFLMLVLSLFYSLFINFYIYYFIISLFFLLLSFFCSFFLFSVVLSFILSFFHFFFIPSFLLRVEFYSKSNNKYKQCYCILLCNIVNLDQFSSFLANYSQFI